MLQKPNASITVHHIMGKCAMIAGVKSRKPSVANPYLEQKNAISSSVNKTDNGFSIEVSVPESVSPSDKAKIIDWLHDYRMQVRRLNPMCVANFRVHENGYSLDIKFTHDVRELAKEGEKVKQLWADSLKYA